MRAALLAGLAVGGFLLIKGGNMGAGSLPLGLVCHNPGNLMAEWDAQAQKWHYSSWQGLSPTQDHMPELSFISDMYGLRAMAELLHNYGAVYGWTSVAEIVTHYAPPSANDTAAYIANVAAWLGVDAYQPLPGGVDRWLPKLIPAMVHQEQGQQPFTQAQVAHAMAMAGLPGGNIA